jgi:hypothetical protein
MVEDIILCFFIRIEAQARRVFHRLYLNSEVSTYQYLMQEGIKKLSALRKSGPLTCKCLGECDVIKIRNKNAPRKNNRNRKRHY